MLQFHFITCVQIGQKGETVREQERRERRDRESEDRQHGSRVVSALDSQQEGLGFDSRSLHVVPGSA